MKQNTNHEKFHLRAFDGPEWRVSVNIGQYHPVYFKQTGRHFSSALKTPRGIRIYPSAIFVMLIYKWGLIARHIRQLREWPPINQAAK